MNPKKFIQMKLMWDRFCTAHPKFLNFLQAVAREPIGEGTVIEVKLKRPDGDCIASNMKITESDVELFQELKAMVANPYGQ